MPVATPPVTSTPSAMPTAMPTPSLEPTEPPEPTSVGRGCPSGSPISFAEFSSAERSCFGSGDVAVRAWIDTAPTFGFIGPIIRPMWLYYPPEGVDFFTLYGQPPSEGERSCEGCFFVHLPPDSSIVLEGPGRWVIATGHRRDPASRDCFYDETGFQTEQLDDATAREACRGRFVLVALEDVPPP
jgi:hypothetical protein